MGLLTRLVLGNQMFVEQFAQAVHDFKVYMHADMHLRTWILPLHTYAQHF